jgi:hypothetical protein
MTPITKYKQAVEKWLSTMIKDGINRLDTTLQREKDEIHTYVALFGAQIIEFDQTIATLNETVQHLSEVRENNALREHIKELHSHVATINDLVKRLFPAAK